MNGLATTKTASSTIIFDKLSIVDNGLLLTNRYKEETFISFSAINKSYIQKHRLSFINKLALMGLLFVLIAFCSLFLPTTIIWLASFLFIPWIAFWNNYKRYQFSIELYDGSMYVKGFKKRIKQDYISLVFKIRKEIFENNSRYNV